MADRVETDAPLELSSSSNGHSSQSNLVNDRSRAAKPRRNRANQAESSMTSNNNNNQQRQKMEEESNEVKYNAAHVIHLFVPVSLCMLAVIISMQGIGYFTRNDGVYFLYTPFTKETESASEIFFMSIGNALTMMCVVIVMTILLIVLYKFRFYKVIHGWLVLSSVVLLGIVAAEYFKEFFKNYNIAVDTLTFMFMCWNFSVLGMICVHWKGPHRLQQFYLVAMSALMALLFIKHLPEWSVWTVLAFLAIWDLIAVLCPHGPLRILVETAQERNEPIFPALIYSSTVAYPYVFVANADSNDKTENDEADEPAQIEPTPVMAHIQPLTTQGQRIAPLRGRQQNSSSAMLIDDANNIDLETNEGNRNNRQQPQNDAEDEHGVKLGLGDFIFYSVLVGKASSYNDWNTTIACYVAILLGLSCTLMLLALFRKALPALPISIFVGITFYFATRGVITPFVNQISMGQYML